MNMTDYENLENLRTGKTDFLPELPEDWSDYIPQNEAAQVLYRLYQEAGDAPIDAAIKVLELSCRFTTVRSNPLPRQ